MQEKRTLSDDEIKTLRYKAKETIPKTLVAVKKLINAAERSGEEVVTVPLASMKRVFGFASLSLGSLGSLGIRPFDFDPRDKLGFDEDPKDPIPGLDNDHNDLPNWNLDMVDP